MKLSSTIVRGILLAAVFCTGLTAMAEEPKLLLTGDLSLFDVRGPVKEITGHPGRAFAGDINEEYLINVHFDRNGRITSYYDQFDKEFAPLKEDKDGFNQRDSRGNILANYDLFYYPICDVVYDKEGQLVRYYCGNLDIMGEVTFIYDKNGERIKAIDVVSTFSFANDIEGAWEDAVRIVDYTIVKRDRYNNWIERNCNYMGNIISEKRTITYYNETPKSKAKNR